MGTLNPLIGKKIDTYEILSVLGQGGMGVVFLAKDTTLDRDVALKMMDAGLARDESFLKRFQSEAKALAMLQNPNIVSIFALRETELGFCIVMEYVQGVTLADVLRDNGALPISRAVHIFRQLLIAFDHAHGAGIIHRDIKPANILLAKDDVVKVTDFGLAKIQAASQATMTMGTGGTLYYMSPEQIRGLANVDKRGDIYSLGMTLYETVTGAVPFTDETDFGIRQAIVEGNIPPPGTYAPSLPKELVRVIMKSIEKDPEKRYQTAAEFWHDLERVVAGERADTVVANIPPTTVPSPQNPKPSSRRGLMTAVITVAAVLALLTGYFLLRPDSNASISVSTTPAGASVTINGRAVGQSPLKNISVTKGDLNLSVASAGYISRDTLIKVMNESISVNLTLLPIRIVPGKATMTLRSNPSGADVLVNGNLVGKTPLNAYATEPGSMRITIQLQGYLQHDTAFAIAAGQSIDVPILLAKSMEQKSKPEQVTKPRETREETAKPDQRAAEPGTLSLTMDPAGEVTIGGQTRSADASSPATFSVPAGPTAVTFKSGSFGTQREQINVAAGTVTNRTYHMARTITIAVRPVYGNITVNNESVGQTDVKVITRGPGRYRIAVTKEQYEIDRIELNGKQVASGDITIAPGFDDRAYKLIFTLRMK